LLRFRYVANRMPRRGTHSGGQNRKVSHMKKTIASLSAAAVMAAGTIAMPTKADAYPAWVIPAIIVAGVGGLVVGGAAVANAQAYDDRYSYGPGNTSGARGNVYVRPTANAADCYVVRERTPMGWRRVQVCN